MEGSTTTSELDALQAENGELRQALEKLDRDNRWLSEQLETLLRRLYGRKSERIDPNQLQLFAGIAVAPEDPQSEEPPKESPRGKHRKGHGRRRFPQHLPRDTVRCTLPEEERVCPDCREIMQEVGTDSCERGHIIRPRILVRRFEKVKYACGSGHSMKVAQAPPALVDKCKYEPSVYAHIAVAKYGDHIPLHRMEGIFRRHGFELSKSTMWDMLARIDELAAGPILAQMQSELLRERILLADETPITIVLEGQEKKSQQGYVWSWRRGQKALYDFTLSRASEGPSRFLGSWSGTLLTDGYSGYDPVARRNKILRAGCWSHARRKFKEALDVGTRSAAPILQLIGRLFRLESAVRKRAASRNFSEDQLVELCRRVREKRSRRLVEKIYLSAAKLQQSRASLEKSKLGTALTYLTNQRSPLQVFLDDPELPIHNNASERALRHVVLGRRNWQFVASERGGHVAAHLYSLIYSCKALGIDPEAYLADVLEAVSTTPASQVATLTPWAWAEAHPEAQIAEPYVPA